MNNTKHFLFQQIDSWFFRESRSMDGSGATALDSVFPPPNNTLMGAIRTQIGDQYHTQNGTNWSEFPNNQELQKIIGYGNDYANLKAQGAWLYHEKSTQLYFPCPLNLLKQEIDKKKSYGFFAVNTEASCHCDLGENVVLPELDYNKQQTPIDDAYLSQVAFEQLLAGKAPKYIKNSVENFDKYRPLVEKNTLFSTEPRLGIERDNQRHKTIDGKLYQTKHIRLTEGWQIYLGVDGMDDDYLPQEAVLRLGGEARMAGLQSLSLAPALPQKSTANDNTQYLVLYLLTALPAIQQKDNQPTLPNNSFTQKTENNLTVWQGTINETKVNIFTAIIGKVERIGGWNMAKHKSLPVRSFIPAGSCWYIQVKDNAQAIIDALHGQFISTGNNDRALGYGQVVVGLPPNTTQIQQKQTVAREQ